MTLPATTAAAPPARAPVEGGEQAERGRGLRILLVDDHADTLRAMKLLLGRRGFLVEAADTMTSALEIAGRERFDLLISDLGLPDGTGFELMEAIKQLQPIRGIALSGFGMERDVQQSRAAGFDEHLTKPVNLQRLEAVIQRLAPR